MTGSVLVYDPTGSSEEEPQLRRQALDNLSGKVVGFIDNAKPNFNHLVDDLADLLTSTYGVSAVIKRSKLNGGIPASDTVLAEFAEQCDLVITGGD